MLRVAVRMIMRHSTWHVALTSTHCTHIACTPLRRNCCRKKQPQPGEAGWGRDEQNGGVYLSPCALKLRFLRCCFFFSFFFCHPKWNVCLAEKLDGCRAMDAFSQINWGEIVAHAARPLVSSANTLFIANTFYIDMLPLYLLDRVIFWPTPWNCQAQELRFALLHLQFLQFWAFEPFYAFSLLRFADCCLACLCCVPLCRRRGQSGSPSTSWVRQRSVRRRGQQGVCFVVTGRFTTSPPRCNAPVSRVKGQEG